MKKTDLKKFLSTERGLDKVVRFSTYARIKDQNVSEHSFHTTLYAMIFADMEEKLGNKVDKVKVLKTALLHDLEESMTGDIIYGFKHVDERLLSEIKRLSLDMFRDLMGNLPEYMSKEYVELWKNSKDMNTIEGRIIEAADKIEGLMYSLEELSLGNKGFQTVVEKYKEILGKINLKSAKILLEQLL